MQTWERGEEEERLNLLGEDNPRLDEAPTAWRERGGCIAWWLVGKQEQKQQRVRGMQWLTKS